LARSGGLAKFSVLVLRRLLRSKSLEGCSRGLRRRSASWNRPSRPLRGASGRGQLRLRDAAALFVNRGPPAVGPVLRLAAPFEEMGQQHGHAIGQLALFAFAHVFDLVGQMFDVEFGKPAGAQEASLLL